MDRRSRDLTSYDLLKSLALLGMIVDHLGFYLFPDQPWIQAVARIVGPTWFFLFGYSRSRALSWQLLAATSVLAVVSFVVGIGIFPLSALMSLIVVRITIDPLARRMLRGWPAFCGYAALLVLLVLPSAALFEYGTLVLLAGMLGYIVRHDAVVQTARRRNTTLIAMWFITVAAVTGAEEIVLRFSPLPFIVMAAGQGVTFALLCRFRPASYPDLTRRLSKPVAAALRFCGRHTLEIYVAHLLLFKVLACILEPGRFPFLRFQVFYHPW